MIDHVPRKKLHHIILSGHAHELTFSCYRRLPLLTRDKEGNCGRKLSNDDNVKANAYWGFAYSSYFQKKYKDANEYATRYLQSDPNDEVMKFIKQKSDEAMRGVFEPKLIKLK
jgi:hypothetical protein